MSGINPSRDPGVIAWGDDGTGFVLQVTTPDWPGAGGLWAEGIEGLQVFGDFMGHVLTIHLFIF